MASNGNNNHTDINVPVSFLAEMARIVGSTGDYLIFEGQDEMIEYLTNNDCQVFTEEDDITEWVKDNKAVEDVFDNEEMIAYISDACSPDEVFDESVLAEYVAEVRDAVDVFSAEDIKKAYKHLVNTGDITEEVTAVLDTVALKGVEDILKENKALKAENKALKAENEELTAEMEKRHQDILDYHKENEALKHQTEGLKYFRRMLLQTLMPNPHDQDNCPRDPVKRPGFDGFVWTWNANAGHGEWC